MEAILLPKKEGNSYVWVYTEEMIILVGADMLSITRRLAVS